MLTKKTNKREGRRTKRVSKEGGKPGGVHNEFTHFPHDPTCKVCMAARMQKTSRCKRNGSSMRPDALLFAAKFGDRITADHAIMDEENKSAEDKTLCACVIQDGFTNWLQSYPCKTKGQRTLCEASRDLWVLMC